MKAILFGEKSGEVEKEVRAAGFSLVGEGADIVICYGGDGTLFRAEREYPGVPKLMLKGSRICKLCAACGNEEALRRAKEGSSAPERIMKIEAHAKGGALVAMNDLIVHNKDPRHAMRYSVSVNGKPLGGEIIGDGIVVATPLGSTGYYRSITDSFFEVGIGLAFNNSTEQSDHAVLRDESEITLRIVRGPAVVYADNQPDSIDAADGDEIRIVKSAEFATILKV